jgi:hypothetical protein
VEGGIEITNCDLAPAPAPASFYLSKTLRNFIEKIMVPEEVCVNFYNSNSLRVKYASIQVKKSKKVPYLISRYFIKLSGAQTGAEIRICGSAEKEPKEIFSASQHCSQLVKYYLNRY